MKDDKKKKKRVDVSKFINLEPSINEAKSTTAVLTFGRFNPMTTGHEKLVNKIAAEAGARKATPLVFASHTADKKKNPLSYESKVRYLQKAFGNMIQKSDARTIIEVAKELDGKFSDLVIVVGSDRVQEFQRLLTAYNGKEYNYKTIEVISAGERDPDADDVSGMSASKLRSLVSAGDFDAFQKGLPTKLKQSAKEVYSELRKNMELDESISNDLDEENLNEREPLTIQQRRSRAITMKRYASRIARARERAVQRKASPEKLKIRARRKAKDIIRQKILKQRNYDELSASEKIQIDKRILNIPKTVFDRIATRQLPAVRKAETLRLAAARNAGKEDEKTESINAAFENFLSESVGSPGEAKAKPSTYTKKYHTLYTKEGTVKHDRRFKFNRRKENPYFKELEDKEKSESFLADANSLMEQVEGFIKEANGATTVKLFVPVTDKDYSAKVSKEMKAKLGIDATSKSMVKAAVKNVDLDYDGDVDSQENNPAVEFGGDEKPNMTKMIQKKMAGELKHTKRGTAYESVDKADPSNREYGTDSLVKILKDDTPGQKNESREIPNTYGNFNKGSRVRFAAHSLAYGDENNFKEGTVIGSNVQHLRIRSDEGMLYKIRHANAELIEDTSDKARESLIGKYN